MKKQAKLHTRGAINQQSKGINSLYLGSSQNEVQANYNLLLVLKGASTCKRTWLGSK